MGDGYEITPVTRSFTIASDDVVNIDFSIVKLPRFSIQGYVYDESTGDPLEGVDIIGSSGQTSSDTTTDSSGHYVLDDLLAGDFNISASKNGYIISPLFEQPLGITNTDIGDADFSAQMITHHVSGTITTSGDEGHSPENVLVTITGARTGFAYTDAGGAYSIELMECASKLGENCSMLVTASKPGYYFAIHDIPITLDYSDVNDVNFSGVYQPGWISGSVCRKASCEENYECEEGIYPRGVRINGVRAGGVESSTAYTDINGEFTIGPFTRGTGVVINLAPELDGYSSCGTVPVALATSEVILSDPLSIKFTNGVTTYRIEGYTRTGFFQTCVGGVEVILSDGNGLILNTTESFDDDVNCGWYQFTGLPADTYMLSASKPCYGVRPSSRTAEIVDSDVEGMNFNALDMTYVIQGTVTEVGTSDPISGVALSLYQGEELLQNTVSDENGLYAFGFLSNGIYQVHIETACFPGLHNMTAVINCADAEMNFECRGGLGESKRQEASSRRDSLMRVSAIDNKGREADNGDMETTADKGSASAISLQASSRTEASVPVYYFYHWDHLGTTRLITNESGAVVSRHDYEPFGVEIPPTNEAATNSHKYTGHERDALSGMDYMHFRYYGSNIGRFMKPDNVTGSPLNPQNWNLYSYVRGNPVNMNDPTGHWGEATHNGVSFLVYYIVARSAGVSSTDALNSARAFGNAVAKVDQDKPANPLIRKWFKIHFSKREEAWNNVIPGLNLDPEKGHSIEDVSSHKDYEWPFGQLKDGKEPDKFNKSNEEKIRQLVTDISVALNGDPTYVWNLLGPQLPRLYNAKNDIEFMIEIGKIWADIDNQLNNNSPGGKDPNNDNGGDTSKLPQSINLIIKAI